MEVGNRFLLYEQFSTFISYLIANLLNNYIPFTIFITNSLQVEKYIFLRPIKILDTRNLTNSNKLKLKLFVPFYNLSINILVTLSDLFVDNFKSKFVTFF